jgi:hypothetical protein
VSRAIDFSSNASYLSDKSSVALSMLSYAVPRSPSSEIILLPSLDVISLSKLSKSSFASAASANSSLSALDALA